MNIPIIDIHTHIGQLPGAVGDRFAAEDLMYICEHEDVRFMLVSSASATTICQHTGTEEVVSMVEKFRGKLGGMLWINPHDPRWRDDVTIALENSFYGIKLHPVLDHYAVNLEALGEIFRVAQDQKWPILTHTDEDGTSMDAAKYEPLIQAYPDVKLILAHLRWGAIPLAKRYANVFVDTTYMDPLTVEIGVDALGPAKILFGTDAAEGFTVGHAPGCERPLRSYAGIIKELRDRGITDSALQMICYDNARSLFNIGEV